MAFEELKAEVGLLLEQARSNPRDLHEAYQQLRQQLDELRGLGMPLPADLLALEKTMEEAFNQDLGEAPPAT